MHTATDQSSDAFFLPWDHRIELQRVDATGDIERFENATAMQERYDAIVANEPEIVFVVAVADNLPVAAFRRDGHPSLLSLSDARQKRAVCLCAGAQSRHRRRFGDQALTALAS